MLEALGTTEHTDPSFDISAPISLDVEAWQIVPRWEDLAPGLAAQSNALPDAAGEEDESSAQAATPALSRDG